MMKPAGNRRWKKTDWKNQPWRRTSAGLAPDWTDAAPGTSEKMAIMCDRDTAGFLACHPLDRRWSKAEIGMVDGACESPVPEPRTADRPATIEVVRAEISARAGFAEIHATRVSDFSGR